MYVRIVTTHLKKIQLHALILKPCQCIMKTIIINVDIVDTKALFFEQNCVGFGKSTFNINKKSYQHCLSQRYTYISIRKPPKIQQISSCTCRSINNQTSYLEDNSTVHCSI